jgi:heptosyltransferase II
MMTKVRILKKLDKLIGGLICCVPRYSGTQQPHKTDIRKILIIRPGGIGDAALLIPAICLLKKKLPEALITVLAEKRNASTFSLCPHVDKVLQYDKPYELLLAIWANYDVVIDTEQWHRLSAIIARVSGAGIAIGYATNERKKLFTHPILYSQHDYESKSFSHLLEPLAITIKNEGLPFLTVPKEAIKNAETLLGKFSGRPFITISPGSSVPEKQWSLNNFSKLASKINQVGFPIVVIGSDKERMSGEMITNGIEALNLAGKTSLLETAAVIEKSSLLVSGDSGVLHIAAGLGCPTVSLFGPSNANKWAPRGKHHITISRNLSCSPCSKFGNIPNCRINARCMAEITVEEVLGAVEKLLNGNPRDI